MWNKHKLKTLLAGATMAGALIAAAPGSALAARAHHPSRAQCLPQDWNYGSVHYKYVRTETRTSELGSLRVTFFYDEGGRWNPNFWCAYNTTGPEQYNTGTWW